MTAVAAVNAPVVAALPPPASLPPAAVQALPEPLLAGCPPQDALERLLAMIEQRGMSSMSLTEQQLRATRDKLHDKLHELLEEAAEALRRTEDHDGHRHKGVFSKIAKVVGEVAGKVYGAAVEVAHDSVTIPADLTVSFFEHAGHWRAMVASMSEDIAQLGQKSHMQESVESFYEGVARFAGALLESAYTSALALACDVAEGDSLGRALRNQAEKLWTSFKENILDNPGFWEVVGAVAKAMAVTGAVMSGGALGVLAVALFVVLEADKRYGFLEAAFGEEAAPWVRLGLELGFAVCSAGAVVGSDAELAMKLAQNGANLVGGAGAVYHGVQQIREADRQADELEQQAAIQTIMNQIAQLHRLIDCLLEQLKEKSDSRDTTRELGSSLTQAAAAAEAAVVMKA